MKRAFNWVVWLTAVILWVLFTGLEISYAVTGKGAVEFSLKTVVVSILIGTATQIGLFLSPWAIAWPSWYQKIVFIAMLPSVFWLLSQIYYDLNEFVSDSRSGMSSEVWMHGIEAVVMVAFLAVYAIQAFRVSVDFLRKPSAGTD